MSMTTTSRLPDLSIDFMSWINAELRKRIDEEEAAEQEEYAANGLVGRLKAYMTIGSSR
jgi:hypothetical protein